MSCLRMYKGKLLIYNDEKENLMRRFDMTR